MVKTINLTVDLNSENAKNLIFNNLKKTGCVVLKNHNVCLENIPRILQEWESYFSDNRKLNWLRTDETDEGFIPICVEMAKNGNTPDYKELYQAHFKKPLPNIINPKETNELFSDLVQLGLDLCRYIDNSLPEEIKRKMVMPLSEMLSGSNNHLIRIIHYPRMEKCISTQRSAMHTDICLLTICFGAMFDGLELQDPRGKLFIPEVSNEDIVVFNSDMLDWATGGYFKSTPHQVETNSKAYIQDRYSIITAIHPLRGAILWNQKTAGEYLRERLITMGYHGNSLNLNDH